MSHPSTRWPRSAPLLRVRRGPLALLAALVLPHLAEGVARAEPGTHGPSISTWDTRASSVAIGFRPGFLSGGHFHILSYSANFSATSGNLSSQFGVHYLNVRPGPGEGVMHGLGATAVALFSVPLGDRYDTGVPESALALYLGVSPTALVSGRSSFVSIPLVLGVGAPWSPGPRFTIVPWVELSPGVNLDTRIRQTTFALTPGVSTVSGNQVTLSDAAIRQILNQAVDFRVSATAGMRAGLDLRASLGESVDFDVSGMLGSLGGAFSGTFVGWIGASFVFRWDRVVSAVLPPEKRLLREDCGDIENRFRACQQMSAPAMSPVPPSAYPPPVSAPPAYPAYPPQPAPPTPPPSSPPSPSHVTTPSPAPRPAPTPKRGSVPTGTFPP